MKMHEGKNEYEPVGELVPDQNKQKLKFNGKINGMIFLGMGNYSEALVEHLHARLNKGISHLSGMQQAGGRASVIDKDEEKHFEDQIESIVKEIALALTGKNVEFDSDLCPECGKYPIDGDVCSGCEAYGEHIATGE